LAKELGYDQVLWTDAVEHEYVQEIGTMNVFFVLDGKIESPYGIINCCVFIRLQSSMP